MLRKKINLSNLCKLCVLSFFIICVPIWCIKASRFNTKKQVHYIDKKSALSLSVYNTTSQQNIKINIEDYLVGVVAAEMPVSFETEALKAQAVAARTYAIKKLPLFGGKGCKKTGADICTDFRDCQAYVDPDEFVSRFSKKDAEAKIEKIRKAVFETFGEAIFYEDEPIEAFFHSTSGGMTERSENAFSKALPYLVSVPSDETHAPKYHEQTKISRKEFIRIINEAFPLAKLKNASLENNVEVVTRFQSGRANEIRFGATTTDAKKVRSLLSLNSTNVSFSFEKNSVIIDVKGFGHGVGMSQTGANAMAKSGKNYREILQHYYFQTQIKNIY